MAKTIDPPNDNGGDGTPGQPGYTPPTDTNAKISVIVQGSTAAFTSDQIAAAGGPWPSFTIKVTPLNGNGAGPSASVEYP